MRTRWHRLLHDDAGQQRRLLAVMPSLRRTLAWIGAVGSGTVALIALLYAYRRREKDPILPAWRRLEQRYARHGLARLAHEPPLRWAARVHVHRPSPELLVLSQNFVEFRYSGKDWKVKPILQALKKHRPFSGVS